MNAELKANLINICLQKCHDVGIEIKSITFDGCTANIKAADKLGCRYQDVSNLRTYFLHPCTGSKIVVFLDPSHMVKLVRNTFEKKRLCRTMLCGPLKLGHTPDALSRWRDSKTAVE